MTVNVNWMVGNVIQIKSEIKVCVKIQQKTFMLKRLCLES